MKNFGHLKTMPPYLRNMLTSVISVAVAMTIVSIVFYTVNVNTWRKSSEILLERNLTQLCSTTELMAESFVSTAMQAFFSPVVSRSFYGELDAVEQLQMMRMLGSYGATNQYIHSIYSYNRKDKIIYASYKNTAHITPSKEFIDQNAVDCLDNVERLQRLEPVPRVVQNVTVSQGLLKVYSFVYSPRYISGSTNEAAIMINVNTDWMRDIVGAASTKDDGKILIFDKDGNCVFGDDVLDRFQNSGEDPVVKQILQSTESGAFLDSMEGVYSHISFTKSSKLGWSFVIITPYSSLRENFRQTEVFFVLISVFTFLLAFGIYLLFALRQYKSTQAVFNDNIKLMGDNRTSRYTVRMSFLRGLINQEHNATTEEISQRFHDYAIAFGPEDDLYLCVSAVDNLQEYIETYSGSERKANSYAIINIYNQICRKRYACEAVEMQDERFALLLKIDFSCYASRSAFFEELSTLLHEANQQIVEQLSISVSTALGNLPTYVHGLQNSYLHTREELKQRMILGLGIVIQPHELYQVNPVAFEYQIDKEHRLISCLKTGRYDEAYKLADELLTNAVGFTYAEVVATAHHIMFALNIYIASLPINSADDQSYDFNRMLERINTAETMKAIRYCVASVLAVATARSGVAADTRLEGIATRVVAFIEAQYSNPSLSLNMIAEAFNLSIGYLGKVFKKGVGITIAESITLTRIENAKHLLSRTESTIDDVAHAVGFGSASYFHKVFKKVLGMTPMEYRKRYRSGDTTTKQ